jgi:caa(3)-type oxidase subunit IV
MSLEARTEHATAEAEHPEGEHHEGAHSEKHYIKIWALLLVLLVVSVVGPLAEIRPLTLMTAFGIAVVKAALVCKHFMHLNVQPKIVTWFLVTALVFMGLFFFGTAPDVLHHSGQNWENLAAQAEVERGLAAMAEAEAAEAAEFDAQAAFEATCGPCHGMEGAGDGPTAASLDPHPANFTDPTFWETRDREHVINVIQNGGAAVGRSPLMPSFGASFSEEEVQELADYVVSLGPGE